MYALSEDCSILQMEITEGIKLCAASPCLIIEPNRMETKTSQLG
jgi:hypothetical protein